MLEIAHFLTRKTTTVFQMKTMLILFSSTVSAKILLYIWLDLWIALSFAPSKLQTLIERHLRAWKLIQATPNYDKKGEEYRKEDNREEENKTDILLNFYIHYFEDSLRLDRVSLTPFPYKSSHI